MPQSLILQGFEGDFLKRFRVQTSGVSCTNFRGMVEVFAYFL